MQTISIRDPVNNLRMFDLTLDTNGNVIIVLKIGKIKVSTALDDVLTKAVGLQYQQNLNV